MRADGSRAMACERCVIADRFGPRLRGLLGRRSIGSDEGILIRPAGSIHMFFMRFAIDAVFLDSDDVVLDVVSPVRPWRVAGCRGAKAVLELAEGEAARRGVRVGMQMSVETAA